MKTFIVVSAVSIMASCGEMISNKDDHDEFKAYECTCVMQWDNEVSVMETYQCPLDGDISGALTKAKSDCVDTDEGLHPDFKCRCSCLRGDIDC